MADGRAEVRTAPRDCAAAARRLAAASKFAESAGASDLHAEASFVLYYDAARNALAAVLASEGKRVTDGRGAHALTIREAGKALGPKAQDLIPVLDAARVTRNATEYDAQPVTEAQLESVRATALALLDAAREVVDRRCG